MNLNKATLVAIAGLAAAGLLMAQAPQGAANPAPKGKGKGGPPRCVAPGGSGIGSYKSPEVLPDGRITFRLCAPNATAVAVGSADNDDISPNTFGGGAGRPMVKDELGLWSVTTDKVIAPDTYRYFFFVDGVRAFGSTGARVFARTRQLRFAGGSEGPCR